VFYCDSPTGKQEREGRIGKGMGGKGIGKKAGRPSRDEWGEEQKDESEAALRPVDEAL
jgi:hypothetical protein